MAGSIRPLSGGFDRVNLIQNPQGIIKWGQTKSVCPFWEKQSLWAGNWQHGKGQEEKLMIQFTFEKGCENIAVCSSTDDNIDFKMNMDQFENRTFRFTEDSLLFDGYSVWFSGNGERFRELKNFAVSLVFAPLGYSDRGDGLFSLFNQEKKQGFYILLKKFGKVQAGFGDGKQIIMFESIRADVKKDCWNVLTVVYRQTEGWCDLYINGVFSNRKQFGRHMPVSWPEGKAYIGKFADQADYRENTPDGIFYGLLKKVMIHEKSLSEAEVKSLHKCYPVERIRENLQMDRGIFRNDWQRPQYHLIAPGKWMNEPHAPFFYEGWYHIFYQANPHSPTWNNIQWGHMISRDMVHWKDMPPALEPQEHIDPDGCWSGSGMVDKEGQPHIFYTAGNNERFPNQSVAMADAIVDADKKLGCWKKHEAPVVEQNVGWLGEFRDPFVWMEKDTYFMLVGSGDENNGGGNAALYSSKDLINWESHGFLMEYEYEKNQEVGHVWELPVLLPLRNERGEITCHILLLCACQTEKEVVETYAFLGHWDAEKKSFQKFHEKAMLPDLGNGTFTGPSGFVTPDNRSVLFTIAQGKRKGTEEYHAGWAHNGGIPIELFWQKNGLRFRPVREIYGLRKKKIIHLENAAVEEANRCLGQISGNRLFLRIQADAEALFVETLSDGQCRTVYYDKKSRRFGVLDENSRQIGKFRGPEDQVNIEAEAVSLEYFLDHSMIEVYLNERKSITLRNYSKGSERKIKLSGRIQKIYSLELWEMESAYD